MSQAATLHTALSVNLNKVATLRNTRYLGLPSLLRAAEACLRAGAQGITVHPRPDERHIRLHDVFELGELLQAWPGREYNIEGNPTQNLLAVAEQVRARGLPLHQLTFVPDAEGQFTSDHGWRFPQDTERLRPLLQRAQALGARVSLFMDAEPEAMAAVAAVGAQRVELYTEPYAAAHAAVHAQTQLAAQATGSVADADAQLVVQLRRFAAAALAAQAQGLGVNAGHDLNRDNLGAFLAAVPSVLEVSIGHALIADALELGYSAAVADYLRCTACAQPLGGAVIEATAR